MKRLTILLTALLAFPVWSADQDKGREYFKQSLEAAHTCKDKYKGTELMSCWIRAFPKKCESEGFKALGQRTTAASNAHFVCVVSCSDAEFWSKHYGECSRELDN
jgi:hypothetical protein